MTERLLSIPEVLRRNAERQPDDLAYTYIDYDLEPAGIEESLTWSEVYRKAQAVAGRLTTVCSPGDRVAVLAPNDLDYIIGFLGAVQAGLIAVPLPLPLGGGLDERAVGALRDSSPAAIVTSSAVTDHVLPYTRAQTRTTVPTVIEVDAIDVTHPGNVGPFPVSATAYLQYTSGSTRQPAGVVLSHSNVVSNLHHIVADYTEHLPGGPPEDMTMVSWLPFYHDLGLGMGVLLPLVMGRPAVVMSPMAFLQRPFRWIQQLAAHNNAVSGAPNFAFDVAVRRTSDADMEGVDLSRVMAIVTGGERVNPGTVRRFNDRFGSFGLPRSALRSSYGLAEATVYVVATSGGAPATEVHFDVEKLSAGRAERCAEGGSALVGCGPPRSCDVRIVDPETMREKSAGEVGEIWVHGDQVSSGYWRNPDATARTFRGQLIQPTEATPRGPWLRTGDLGVMFDGELFVVGRIKDMVIVDGRNHYPDDIEATIQPITAGRAAAVAVTDQDGERLVVIAELRAGSDSPAELFDRCRSVKRQIASAVKNTHGLRVSDVVLVAPGSVPVTTSGKVRRSECVQRYLRGELSALLGAAESGRAGLSRSKAGPRFR
jgi:long chain fatty acid CoA FadD26